MTAATGAETRLLNLGLAALAAMNGWAPRLLAEDAPAVSLFAILTVGVALEDLSAQPRVDVAPWVAAGATVLILAPSGVAAWLALALIAAAAPWPRAPRLLLGGLATAELFAAAGLNAVKSVLLPAEAALAGGLLRLAGFSPEASGNVLEVDGRLTIVATGCSGAPGALFAALGAAAILRRRAMATDLTALALAGAIAASSAFMANLLRLAAMATSADVYALAHGQAGALAADLAATAGVIAGVLLAERIAR